MERNGLVESEYVEPYAGGSGVALALLFEGFASRIHINDFNRSIHAFWHSVLREPEALMRLIRDTPVSMRVRKKQQSVQVDADASMLELGYSTFFLNRVNRSGIIGAGVIGGKHQSGTWKMDARFNKVDLVQRIAKIARFAPKISLYNLDAEALIKDVLPTIKRPALVYLDPPYYVKGHELYTNFYDHTNHVRVAKLVAQMEHPWIISYDNVPEIEDMYSQYRSIKYLLSYTAGPIPAVLQALDHSTRPTGVELMFFSPVLDLPDFHGRLMPARRPSGIGLGGSIGRRNVRGLVRSNQASNL